VNIVSSFLLLIPLYYTIQKDEKDGRKKGTKGTRDLFFVLHFYIALAKNMILSSPRVPSSRKKKASSLFNISQVAEKERKFSFEVFLAVFTQISASPQPPQKNLEQ